MSPRRTARLLLLLSAVSCAAGRAEAQLDPTWTLSDPGLAAFDVAADPLGGVVAVGTTLAPADAWIRSYDDAGGLRWSSTFDAGLAIDDALTLVAVEPNGDVIAAGRRIGFVGPTYVWDVLLRRYDRQGNLLWARSYDGTFGNRIDEVAGLATLPDGSIVLAGNSNGASGSQDLCVWKYDAAGTLLWTARVDGVLGLQDHAASVALDALGNVYASGASGWTPGSNGDVLVASFTPAGGLRWAHELPGPLGGPERGNAIATDAAGRAFVAATTRTPSAYQAVLLAYDSAGSLLWSRASANGAVDGRGVVVTDAGAVVLYGQSQDAGAISGITLDAFDAAGTFLWGHQRPRALPREIVARTGGAVEACGVAYEATTTIGSAWLARYESDGTESWARVHGTQAASEAFEHLAPAPAGGLYIAGWPTSSLYLSRWDSSDGTLCYGDGLGTPCPCGNASAPGSRTGCASSLGQGGSLVRQGVASVSADTLTLSAAGLPASSALCFQGTQLVDGGMGNAFGDGLRCVAGTVVRLGTQTAAGGAAQWPGLGDPPLHVRGLVAGPGTRAYQVWYRNAAAYCTSATFNLTNAVRVVWQS